MKPIIAIRPEPGFSRSVAAGRVAGLVVEGLPLFEVRAIAWEPVPSADFDALLLGSANALRHAGARLADYRHLPVHAVGEETAREAVAAGFSVARVGEGGLQALLDEGSAAPLRFLRLTGAAHVPLVAPAGSSITACVVYESVALAMSAGLAERLREGALVLLHSAEAARHFAAECDRLGIARGGLALAALGPRIAAAAGAGWAQLRSAGRPRESALLALAHDMCH